MIYTGTVLNKNIMVALYDVHKKLNTNILQRSNLNVCIKLINKN